MCPPCLPSFFLCLQSCLPSCGSLCPSCLPSFAFVSLLFPFDSLLVSVLGHCVRLVSLLFPFDSLFVSLLVGHCVRLVSIHSFFVSGLFLPSCGSLCPSCLPSFAFVSLLLPFDSLLVCVLVDHCVRLVSLLLSLFPFLSPFLLVIVSVLSPFCLRSCLPSCWSLCPPCLPSVFFGLGFVPLVVGHCVRLVSLPFRFVSLLVSWLVIVSALSHFCLPLSPVLSPFLLVTVFALSSFLSPCVSGLVSLLVGHCVRIVSLLFPCVSSLVPLLIGHCVHLVSLLPSFLCLPCLLSVSLCLPLFPCCLPSCWSLCLSCLPFFLLFAFLSPFIVSALSPFLSPFVSSFVSLLVGRFVRLVSLLFPSCLLCCLPSCWSLCPPYLPSCLPLSPFLFVIVSLLLPCLPSCWSLCSSCLPSVSFCLPSCWSLCPPCLSLCFLFSPFLSSFLLVTVHLASLLVDVSKSGLGNALLSNLFWVYGGVIFFTVRWGSSCVRQVGVHDLLVRHFRRVRCETNKFYAILCDGGGLEDDGVMPKITLHAGHDFVLSKTSDSQLITNHLSCADERNQSPTARAPGWSWSWLFQFTRKTALSTNSRCQPTRKHNE